MAPKNEKTLKVLQEGLKLHDNPYVVPVEKTSFAGKKIKNDERGISIEDEVINPAAKKKKPSRYPVSRNSLQTQKNSSSSAIPVTGNPSSQECHKLSSQNKDIFPDVATVGINVPAIGNSSSQEQDKLSLQNKDALLDASHDKTNVSASNVSPMSKLIRFFSDPLHSFGDSELGNMCASLAQIGRSLLATQDVESRNFSEDLPPHFTSSLFSLVRLATLLQV